MLSFTEKKRYYLSGAIGTEIQRRGFPTKLPLWSAQILFDRPDVLENIHADYISAGADIVTTNTFRTQRRTLEKAGLGTETERINSLAVELCVAARKKTAVVRPVYIAASIAPLEDCYSPELVPNSRDCEQEHAEQVAIFERTPVDFYVLETFNCVREAEAAAKAVSNTDKDFFVSFVTNKAGDILSGESWEQALDRILPYEPLAVLVNCIPIQVANRALEKLIPLVKGRDVAFGAYANGSGSAGSEDGWDFNSVGSPARQYAEACKHWEHMGAKIIGGCCGTSPEFTKLYSNR